jgi:hypothetical protein
MLSTAKTKLKEIRMIKDVLNIRHFNIKHLPNRSQGQGLNGKII